MGKGLKLHHVEASKGDCVPIYNTFPYNLFLQLMTLTLSDASAEDGFLKTWGLNMKLLKTCNFSFCPMFHLFSIIVLSFRDFPKFLQYSYKVVCCEFVACGKGLIEYLCDNLLTEHIVNSSFKHLNYYKG